MCKNKQNDTDDALQLLTNSVSTLSTQISTLVSSLTSGVPKPVNVIANSLLLLLLTLLQRQPPNSCLHVSPSPLNAVDHPRAQYFRQSLLYNFRLQPRMSRRSLPRCVRPLFHNSQSRPLLNHLHLLRSTSSSLWTDVVSKKSLKSSTKTYVSSVRVKQYKTHQMTTGKSSVRCGLKCAPVRLLSAEFFLTGFHTDKSCVEIPRYVSCNLNCTCECLPTTHNYYASFKLCVDIGRPNALYDANHWPVGTKIGRYFPPRKYNTANSTHL